MNTGVVIITTTTTDTSYTVGSLQLCTSYNANVTAASSSLKCVGSTVTIVDRTPGGEHRISH